MDFIDTALKALTSYGMNAYKINVLPFRYTFILAKDKEVRTKK